ECFAGHAHRLLHGDMLEEGTYKWAVAPTPPYQKIENNPVSWSSHILAPTISMHSVPCVHGHHIASQEPSTHKDLCEEADEARKNCNVMAGVERGDRRGTSGARLTSFL
ncbi:unnamed protein product, partial [Ectocarpus sp. 12 AP-2014]